MLAIAYGCLPPKSTDAELAPYKPLFIFCLLFSGCFCQPMLSTCYLDHVGRWLASGVLLRLMPYCKLWSPIHGALWPSANNFSDWCSVFKIEWDKQREMSRRNGGLRWWAPCLPQINELLADDCKSGDQCHTMVWLEHHNGLIMVKQWLEVFETMGCRNCVNNAFHYWAHTGNEWE